MSVLFQMSNDDHKGAVVGRERLLRVAHPEHFSTPKHDVLHAGNLLITAAVRQS